MNLYYAWSWHLWSPVHTNNNVKVTLSNATSRIIISTRSNVASTLLPFLQQCCRFRQQCRTKFRPFDKVERCFDIVAVVDGALCAACISDVRIKTSLSASWVCPCRLPDLSRSLTASSTPSGQPQRKPAGQMCHACSVVLPAVVDWQIVDVAVIRRWSLVDRHPSGTGELVRADSLHHDVELVRDSYTRRQTCIF